MTVANGFTNNGVIECTGNYATDLTVTTGTLINAPGAAIHLEGGSGFLTDRILADLDNQGTIELVNRDLVIDGTDLAMPLRSLPLPASVRMAAHSGGHRFGLTVKVAAKAVEVTVRAGAAAAAPARFSASVPIGPEQRKRLLDSAGAVLARGGYHRVTPYFDDARRPGPDLAVPANCDRWRNPADRHLSALYRAWHRLGGRCPPSLDSLRKHLLAAAAGPAAAQQAALAHYNRTIAGVHSDISRCGADRTLIAQSLDDLPAAREGQ